MGIRKGHPVRDLRRPILLAVGRVASPLAYRDFRLLWLGQTLSALGNPLQTIALAWLVLDLTGSAVALGTALLVASLPGTALTLVGGVVTDRYAARTVMLWSDAARAVVTGLIAVLALIGALPLWVLYALLFLYGMGGAIFGPAAHSITPRLVPEEKLEAANSLNQSTPQIALLIGAPLGGALVALIGPAAVIGLNAAAFAVGALASLAIAPLASLGEPEERRSVVHDALAALAYVWGRTWLVSLLMVDSVVSLTIIGPLGVGLPLLARQHPTAGAESFGLMLAGFGAGSIAGMLFAGVYGFEVRRGLAFCLLMLCQGPLLIGLGSAPMPVAAALLALMGLLNGVATVLYIALIQGKVAQEIMGRVMSLVLLSSFGLVPLSQLVAGLVAEAAGPSALFASSGVLVVVAALGGLLLRPLRRLD